MPRWGMVIDLLKCIGCYGCQMSCKAENATPPGVTLARVEVTEVGTYPNVTRVNLPLLCMQCNEPPCEKVCPTKATQIREDGIVFVDEEKCIGCKYCMIACPYGARYFVEDTSGYFGDQGLTPFEETGYAAHAKGVVHEVRLLPASHRRWLGPGANARHRSGGYSCLRHQLYGQGALFR